jgi:endogenous inhibitor of DNA gyrase (YacG/DUF329 family)
MFTWECPTCGREVDIAESECPHCSKQAKAAATAVATEHAIAAARPSAEQRADRPAVPMPPRGERAAPLPPPAQRVTVPRRQPAPAWGLRGQHVAIFAVLAVAAVAAGVFFARPDLFRRAPLLQDVPLTEGSGDSGSAYLGEIEVAGVRTWYDTDYKPKVTAVVINHSESAQANVNLKVELRTREASMADTPLASFEIRLDKELGPREARDVQVDLNAMGTLASLPAWHSLRVDLQRL